jgi:hypothetical protein
MPNNHFTCPVCGYPDLDEPPYDKYGCSSFDICPSCGTEFGLDDKHATLTPTAMHDLLRRQWAASGYPWMGSATLPPADWNPEEQLRGAGLQIIGGVERPSSDSR